MHTLKSLRSWNAARKEEQLETLSKGVIAREVQIDLKAREHKGHIHCISAIRRSQAPLLSAALGDGDGQITTTLLLLQIKSAASWRN